MMKQRVEELHQAQVNRSIRTIKAELEYLCDMAVISPQTLSDLLSRVPPQTLLHAPVSVGAVPQTSSEQQPPSFSSLNLNNTNDPISRTATTNGRNGSSPAPFNEKADGSFYGPGPMNQNPNSNFTPPPSSPYNNSNAPPPQPVWTNNAPAGPPPLATATALYAYTSTDEGDLELQPNDSIAVTEYMNAEWWKGKSLRTGHVGIFPRSYVEVVKEKSASANTTAMDASMFGVGGFGGKQQPPPMENQQMAMQDGQQPQGHAPGKFEAQSKKFGRKLGNAAIFGAGATLGGDIVNAIL